MATARRRKSLALTEQLQQAPYRFEFFQAVRLLELAARSRAQGGEKFARVPVARGAPPNRESIRFQAQASLAFKGADLERVTVDETIEPDDSEAPQKQWQMLVNSFGLFGSNGVLPYHISELVIQRLRQKDRSLVNFLDDRHVRIYAPNGLFQTALKSLGLTNAWQQPGNYWGFSAIGLESVADARNSRIVVIDPLVPGLADSLANSPFWTYLPPVRDEEIYRIPAAWPFGGVYPVKRLAVALTNALVEGGSDNVR